MPLMLVLGVLLHMFGMILSMFGMIGRPVRMFGVVPYIHPHMLHVVVSAQRQHNGYTGRNRGNWECPYQSLFHRIDLRYRTGLLISSARNSAAFG